jgi:hypothetical protein
MSTKWTEHRILGNPFPTLVTKHEESPSSQHFLLYRLHTLTLAMH